MNVFQRMKGRLFTAYAKWKGDTFDFNLWRGKTFWGIDNSQLTSNETIFSVITRLANITASLPVKLHQSHETKTNQAYDVLVNMPNDNMHGFDFINKMEVSRNEKGNAYAVIVRDMRMQVEKLVPIDPDYVTPFLNNDDENLWYEVRGADRTYYVHNMNMVHIKHITGINRWKGISPLDVLRNTLNYDKAVQEFSLTEMQKPESFTIEYAANVDENKKRQITENFREFYKNNGGILFKEPGVNIDRLEKKYFASDTIKAEQITRTRVANVFNVPVSFLNESEGQTYSSNEQMMIQFVQMGLMPTIKQYENEFNRKLLTASERLSGFYFKFNLNGLLRGDTKTRTQFYQMAVRSGILSQDEIRQLEDHAPVGGNASKLWVSGDLYPIDTEPSERKKASEGGEVDSENKEQVL